ncbi:hypothetical protein EOM82_07810 [bacterium]|nr:hypothetical protein [bacterium]
MRLLNEPKCRKSAVAAAAITIGKPVYLNTDGKWAHPTDDATALKAVYFAHRNPEYCVGFTGYSPTIAAGELMEGINGFQAQFETAELYLADTFASVDKGTALGITASGQIAAASAATNTTGLLRLVSFTGDTNSGLMEAIVDFRI